MDIDPRLNGIDDCLYRVAARILIIQDNKVLLIKEASDGWWALPGGGVDHGETIEQAVMREIEEELGVHSSEVSSDFQIAHYTIGSVVNGVPRMNLFFKVSMPTASPKNTDHVIDWKWFTKAQFMTQELHASYDKESLGKVIFGD